MYKKGKEETVTSLKTVFASFIMALLVSCFIVGVQSCSKEAPQMDGDSVLPRKAYVPALEIYDQPSILQSLCAGEVVDTRTGVHYLVVSRDGGVAVTPVLAPDGRPAVFK